MQTQVMSGTNRQQNSSVHPNSSPRPLRCEVNANTIPHALKELPQWVGWEYKFDADTRKFTKVPLNSRTGGKAQSNNPATWAPFDPTLEAYRKQAKFDGIGFAFSDSDGLTGIDIDHVIDPETGEIDPRAQEILEQFKGTYCEISPSGTGLRIFCRGKPGRSGKNEGKTKWLEVYTYPSHRYLTVTGHHYPQSANTVTEQQDALDWLNEKYFKPVQVKLVTTKPAVDLGIDDTALLDKARSARNGDHFRALFDCGDISAHGGDDSAADLALCSLLAFWTQKDADRMDRLFRRSASMRKKWERDDYRQRTIDKAITECREVYTVGGKGMRNNNVIKINQSDTKNLKTDLIELDKYRGTDSSNAELFLSAHGDDVRFCPSWDKWLLWTETHWRIDDRLNIERLAADIPRVLYSHAADAVDTTDRRQIASLASKMENINKQRSMLVAARHRVTVHHSDLDKGGMLLTVKNGTINLETGELR